MFYVSFVVCAWDLFPCNIQYLQFFFCHHWCFFLFPQSIADFFIIQKKKVHWFFLSLSSVKVNLETRWGVRPPIFLPVSVPVPHYDSSDLPVIQKYLLSPPIWVCRQITFLIYLPFLDCSLLVSWNISFLSVTLRLHRFFCSLIILWRLQLCFSSFSLETGKHLFIAHEINVSTFKMSVLLLIQMTPMSLQTQTSKS